MTAFFAELQGELFANFASGYQLWICLAALVYLFFAEKEWRRPLVYPLLVLLVVLFNPLFYYRVWPLLAQYAFSRLLWTLPVAIGIALACVSLVRKCKALWLQTAVVCLLALLLMKSGPYMYKGQDNGAGTYRRATNAYHLEDNVLAITEFLLEQEPYPWTVSDFYYSVWLRDVSPEIRLYTGRNYYNVRTQAEREMQSHLTQGASEISWIRDRMLERKYTYFVHHESFGDTEAIISAGFELLETFEDRTGKAYVYRVIP